MKITICSAFRDATPYLTRYFVQVRALREQLARWGDSLSLVLGEGDHTDDTRAKLPGWVSSMAMDAQIIQVDHGGPDHGSVVNAQRFRQLAYVWSRIWAQIPDDAGIVIFLESDLIWHPDTMLALIGDVQGMTAIAPMVMLERERYPRPMFYDLWGFARDGKPFNQRPPYFPGWDEVNEDTIEIDSAGSCLVIDGTLARSLVWDDRLIVGLCEQIHAQEGQVWLNCAVEVIHP